MANLPVYLHVIYTKAQLTHKPPKDRLDFKHTEGKTREALGLRE